MHVLGMQINRKSEHTDKVIGLGGSPIQYGTV